MTGYIIYYQQDGGERHSQSAGPTDTTATITGLMAEATYTVTMVATSSTLPSIETELKDIAIGMLYFQGCVGWVYACISSTEPATISLTSSPSSPVMAGATVTLTCSVSLPTGVTGTPDIQWKGPGVTPTPADPTSSGPNMVSSDLTLSEIATSQAGQYTCTATLSGSVSTSVTITVQSKFRHVNLCVSVPL